MILTNEITLKIASKNKAHYSKILNKSLEIGEEITIPTNYLPKGTKLKVDVLCDYCRINVSKVEYREYVKMDKYSCSKCWKFKMEDICMSKYGVKNPFESEEVKKKIKETIKNKYGVDHPMKLDSVKEKIKSTCLKKYGETHHLKLGTIKEKQRQTNLSKYGVDNVSKLDSVRSKVKETNLEKYGNESYLNTEEFKSKSKSTILSRYGVENAMQNAEIKQKAINTNLDRYGVPSYMMTPEFREQSRITNLEKYGNESHQSSESFRKENFKISQDINYIKYIGNNISEFQCDLNKNHQFHISLSDYYNRTRSLIPICTICNPIGDSVSIKEKEVFEFIQSIYKGEIIQSYKDERKEIDIYLPELKLGFEFNGLYWHSDDIKDRNYHLDKTNYFKDRGIRIIHIWEDDWMFKNEILKSQIRNWIGLNEIKIGARNCEISEISDVSIVKDFLDTNHIQGSINSIVKLGLYLRGELIGIMTLDHSEGRKKMSSNEWNLSRFCNKLNTNVIGGASKLLKFFIDKYNPTRIISYSDKDWSVGGVYESMGFSKISESRPDYKYIVGNKRVHKSRFRKSNLKTDKTESSYMKDLGYHRIFDCGKIKFEKIIDI